MKQVWLEHFDEGGYKIYRVPCIIATQKGTVIAGYESRRILEEGKRSLETKRGFGGKSPREGCNRWRGHQHQASEQAARRL